MAGRSQRETSEPLTVEKRFRTEFFGFDRVEVLTYIERISDANAQKARALEEAITALQKDLYDAQGRTSTLERKADEVFSELKIEKKRAEEAVAEADALRKEVKKANDEIAAVRSRLFARDQENATLKNDNARLTQTVDNLTQELSSGVVRITGRLASQQPAPAPAPQRDEEKAQAQRERLKALRAQLAAVDAKILEATSELQRATDGITAALEGEMAAPDAASLPSYGRGNVSPYAGTVAQGGSAPAPDSLRGFAIPPAPREISTPAPQGAPAPAPQKELAAAAAQTAQGGEAGGAVPAGFSEREYTGPYRSQYRATHGRPLPAPGVTPQGARPRGEMPEQYDAVQWEARGMPSEGHEEPEEPVVDIPQVPPRKQPESEAQIPFGEPHAPRAMPFAPFDPYTPHTAPYIEPGAEAAHILKTPPPPPPQTASPTKPYVPRPTPIRTGTSLSEPLVQTAGTALAAMPRTEPKRASAQEPVIIPYSMPIPPPAQREAPKQGVIPFTDGWERLAPQRGLKEEERRGSALSEDLLNHLNRLINGEEKP